VTWFIHYFILLPFDIEYLQTIAFILVIAALVQLVEMVIQKVSRFCTNPLASTCR